MPLAPSQFLLSHFDRLAEAPGGIARLRALVLQFAAQGKFVEQNPKDEPAEVTLKRSNKNAQILTGKVGSPAPRGWCWTTLGSLIVSNPGGGTPSKNNYAYWDGSIPWASVKDVGKTKYLSQTQDSISEAGLKDSSSNLIPPGRLIVVTRMGLGKLSINTIAVAINQDLRALEIGDALVIDYLYNFFLTQKIEGSGMTVKGIKLAELMAMPVPLPPLAEQRRIVAKVEELMGLCDALEAAQQEREAVRTRLRTSALHQLASPDSDSKSTAFVIKHFSRVTACSEDLAPFREAVLTIAAAGLLTSEATYPKVSFSEVIEELRYGTSRKCAKQPSGTVVLRIPNVVRGEIDLTELKRTEMPEKELRDLALREGDLLIVRSNGSESLVGRVSVVSQDCEGFAYAGYLVRIRLKRERATSAFVQLALSTAEVRSQIEKPIRTTVGVKNINTTEINRLTIPLPPLAEQRRIVAKVDELMAVLDALEATLTTARTTAERLLAATLAKLHAA